MKSESRSSAARALSIALASLLLGAAAAGASALPGNSPETQTFALIHDDPLPRVATPSPPVELWSPLHLVTDSPVLVRADDDPVPGAERDAAARASAPGDEAETPRSGGSGGRKALLLSLLLPGAGEMSLGARGRATGFFIAEGAIWTHFVWFQVAGHLRKDNYIEQAQRHAGVNVSDADDTYWKLLGQYETSQGTGPDAYEETLRREARDLFPSDPAAQDGWVAERLPSGDRAWDWSSSEARAAYRATRENSRRAFDRSKYSIAAAIVNRILSAIDTQIVRRKLSRQQRSESDTPVLLLADTAPDGSGRLYLTRSF